MNFRNFYVAILLAILIIGSVQAQGLKLPAASPAQTITQEFALSTISVSYSRPSMKGRKIFGDLVPFGEVWRTGANQPTKIKFAEDVSVNGNQVPAGEYALYTIPNPSEWTIILSKNTKLWGALGYNQSDDLIRFQAKVQQLPFAIETFTILFGAQSSNTVDLNLLWENVSVSFTVKADIDNRILSSIDQAMQGEKKPYFQAAGYYYEKGLDLNKALMWVNEAVKAQPDAYYMEHLKAKILLKMGNKKEAVKVAESSLKKAEEQKNPDYVALNKKLITEAKSK